MSAPSEVKWKGYAVQDTKEWDKFQVIDFEPKRLEDYDVDLKIEYCGVCGSDVHTITGGWGQPILPLITGHEIVGHVIRVGPNVTSLKVGDRAGVGPQVGSCFQCEACKSDNEQYCPKLTFTYNAKYPNGDIAHGGYATAIRAHEHFVFPLPKDLPLEQIAPMLCAGLTVYSPLKRNSVGPGKSVAVIGIGGLGHFAVQFARALGAENVVAFTHSANKEKDARDLGATDVVVTNKRELVEPWKQTFDVIICTVDVSHGLPLADYLKALRVHGKFIMVAVPDEKLPALHAFDFLTNGAFYGGSLTGSRKEVLEMLDLAVKKGVKSWIEVLPMKEAGKAVQNVNTNKVRYRHVLKVDI